MKSVNPWRWAVAALAIAVPVLLLFSAWNRHGEGGPADVVEHPRKAPEPPKAPEMIAVEFGQKPPTPIASGEEKAGSITGRAITREGVGAASALVTLSPSQNRRTAIAPDTAAGEPLATEADSEGRFAFSNLAIDTYVAATFWEGLGGDSEAGLAEDRHAVEIEIVLGPGGPIAGRAVDAAGGGIPAARVYPIAHNSYPVGEDRSRGLLAVSDEEGRFRFPFLTAMSWKLMVEAPGFEPTTSEHVPAGTEDLRIVLKAGASVAGRVVDSGSGAGIRGMVLVSKQRRVPLGARTTTDESGAFEFTGLAPGEVQLLGLHRSHALVESPSVLTADFEANAPVLLKASPGARVRGRVVSLGGTGISGLRIGMDGEQSGRFEITDAGGLYHFDNVPPGSYALYNLVSVMGERRKIQVSPGATIDVPDWIVRAGIIRGKVVEGSGSPVPGAMVLASARAPVEYGVSNERGEFQLVGPGLRGKLIVVASNSGASSAPATADLDADAEPFLTLALDRPRGTIAGQVVDSRGNPRQARLTVSTYAGLPIPEYRDWRRSGVETPPPGADTGAWDVPIATDSDGYFLATVNTPADIQVYLDEYSPHSIYSKEILAQEFSLRSGESRRNLRLVFPFQEGAAIAGRVQDAHGTPLATVGVIASPQAPCGDSGSTFSDVDGRFLIKGLSCEYYTMQVRAPDYTRVSLADVEAGTMDLVFTLKGAPRVTGYVTDARGGNPVSAYEIAWVDARHPNTRFAQFRQVNHAQGFFELVAPDGGDEMNMDLVAQAAGFAPARVNVGFLNGDSGPFQIALEPSGNPISGVVVDEGGAGIPGALVTTWSAEDGRSAGSAMSATSTADGTFHLAGVPVSAELIEATHPDYVRARLPIDPRSGADVTLVLSSGVDLSGVLSEDGRPVEGAGIRVFGLETAPQFTDSDGFFYMEGLLPGEVTLEIRVAGPDGQRAAYTVVTNVEPGVNNTVGLDIHGGIITLTE